MDWIFRLLFSNFWIFLILFWVLRGLFTDKPRTITRNPRPVFPLPKQEQPCWTVSDKKSDSVPVQQPERIKDHPFITAQSTLPDHPVRNARPSERSTEEESSKKIKMLPRNSLMVTPREGMIWSEVFGPPRSKKPYKNRRS